MYTYSQIFIACLILHLYSKTETEKKTVRSGRDNTSLATATWRNHFCILNADKWCDLSSVRSACSWELAKTTQQCSQCLSSVCYACQHLSVYCCSDLLQPSIPGAQKDHTVSVVDIRGDGGQSVPALSEHHPTRHQLGTPQRLVYIQAAEVIIDGNRLHGEMEVEIKI